MLTSSTSRRRLQALAAACLLSVALPAGAAWAQKTKTKGEAPPPAPPQLTVEIPTIDAVGSNVDETVLRDILNGELVENADALAGLTAESISIPQIDVTVEMTVDGEKLENKFTVSDIELTDIADGIAASLSIAGSTFDAGQEASGEIRTISANSVDIGSILGFYGLVERPEQSELKTIYSDFRFEGGTFEAPEGSCTFGAVTLDEFKARPLTTSFVDMMTVAATMEDEDAEPSPEVIGSVLKMYADILTAFESTPAKFDGFDCDFTDDAGEQVAFSIGGMTMDGFRPGIYPAYSLSDLVISVEGDGDISVGTFDFKEMDLSNTIAVLEEAPAEVTETWLLENSRRLIPAFKGFSFGDIVMDVPNPDEPGGRIEGSLGNFDLTLLNYVNGIPSDVSTRMDNLRFDLPKDSSDEQVQTFIDLGVTDIDASFAFNATWNEAEDRIDIKEVSIKGQDLINLVLTGTIANATEALFDLDPDNALMAAMGVAVRDLKAEITDEGLSDIIFHAVSAEQGTDPETMRPVFAGLAEGTVVGMLAGVAEAQNVGSAIAQFVRGEAKHLTLSMTAKEEPGISIPEFVEAETNPAILVDKVTIEATAE